MLCNSRLTGCPKRPPPAVDVVAAPNPPNPPADAAGAPKVVPAGLAPNNPPPPAAAVVGAPKVLAVCPNGALDTAGAPNAPPPPPKRGLFWKGYGAAPVFRLQTKIRTHMVSVFAPFNSFDFRVTNKNKWLTGFQTKLHRKKRNS